MRDNNEVVRVMLEVERIWKNHRELRLSQLLVNAALESGRNPDIFYIEDETLLNILRQYNEKHDKTKK